MFLNYIASCDTNAGLLLIAIEARLLANIAIVVLFVAFKFVGKEKLGERSIK